MKNKDVIKAFIERKSAVSSAGNLSSTGNCLYSYNTCIAEYNKEGNIIINGTKYSVTTSRHQSLLRSKVLSYKGVLYEVYNIPMDSTHIIKLENRLWN